MYQDQTLTCKDCGKSFVWTASEQEFYASKGFSAPVRCPECRQKNKQAKQGGQMGPRAPREMHEITCANCGSKGEVPFAPRDPSNVLCADCFRKKRDAERGIVSDEAPTTSAPAHDHSDDSTMSDSSITEVTDNGDDSAANDASKDTTMA